MKNVIRKAVMVIATSVLFTSYSANASEECELLISDLVEIIFTAPVSKTDGFTGKRGKYDKMGLEGKAKAANTKLEAWKVDDAMDKLDSILGKVDDLANAPKQKQKLTDNWATYIGDATMDAVDCIYEM